MDVLIVKNIINLFCQLNFSINLIMSWDLFAICKKKE